MAALASQVAPHQLKDNTRTMKRTALALTALVAVAGLATACGEKAASVAEPRPAATTHKPKPKPVDPDVVVMKALANDPAYMTHMSSAAHMKAFIAATERGDLDASAAAARTSAANFDWLANRIDAVPGSEDSDAAQSSMSAFRLCRDTYKDTATALEDRDLSGIQAAGPAIDTCTRGIEAAGALIPS